MYSCNVRWGEGFDHFVLAMGGSNPTDRNQVTNTAYDGAVFKGSYSAHIIQGHTRLTGCTDWSIGSTGDFGDVVLRVNSCDSARLSGNGEIKLDGVAKTILVHCASN